MVDERTFEYPIVAGVITGTEVVDPGPATVSLSSGGRFKSWNVVVPEGATVDLWTLVENYIDYDPPVVAAAQEAAARAEAAAADALLIPDGGADGQALIKSGTGLAWGTATGGGGSLVEDPPGSGLYSPSSAGLTEDPSNPGLYLI